MVLFVLLCNSLQIRARHVVLSSPVRQRSFQRIDINAIMDSSLKSKKGSLYLENKCEKN